MKKLIVFIFLLFFNYAYADVKTLDNDGLNKLLHQGYKKTVVVFWGVYCPYCKALLKTINDNYQYFQKNKFNVIAVSIDKNQKLVNDHLDKVRYCFDVFIDKGDLKQRYNAYYIPVTVIFDKDGHMEDTFPGNKSFNELKSFLED